MAVGILSVEKDSLARQYGIAGGDRLISINGEEINDMMDLQFYSADSVLDMLIETDGQRRVVTVTKDDPYTPLGLEFETYLIDKHHSCKNKCIFCFVDQLPKGLRNDLYFKDDDERLSFLFGNYITLTNLSDKEIERIKKMKISPINISVHTVDEDLRVFMMKNPKSAQINRLMDEFARAGIVMNTQVVLCKGVNDGKYLAQTIKRMQQLYPRVHSCAVVPLGLTRYREGLEKLEGFNRRESARVIEQILNLTEDFYQKTGERLVYPADEFYIRAGLPIPPAEFYGDYAQLENGVGLVRNFIDNFLDEAQYAGELQEVFSRDLATGEAMYPVMRQVLEKANEYAGGKLDITLHCIKNEFFGGNVWVTGLITGTDLKKQLAGKLKTKNLMLCEDMLDSDKAMFLDDETPEGLEKRLDTKITFYPNDGVKMAQRIFGTEY